MKKIFTIAAAILFAGSMMADVIFSFTVTSTTTAKGSYDAVGGTAVCSGSAMSTGGSNEITVGEQTFYKFSSSTQWDFTLADEGTFAEGDVISITGACTTSNKTGKGVTLNGIAVTGNFPASEANTLTYTVVEGDAIVGQTTIQLKRNDSDIKFGTIVVTRENVTPSTDPVVAAEISGESACVLGGSVELTCTAAKATAYQWSVNGAAIDGATAKKYTFTPTAAGTFSFTCEAWNENNTAHVVAAAHEISVMDPANACGELIKATTQGTVSGVIGGTYETNNGTGSSKKLDKKKYYGLVLQSGTFRAGDVFHINVTSAAGLGNCMLYGDKEGTDLIIDAGSEGFYVSGELQVVLPAAATGKNAIYLYREDGNTQWNPTFDWISVTRSCEASNNANLDKVWVVVDEQNMYYDAEADGLTYNLTVPASVDLAQLDVYFSLAHPLASANVTSPLHFTVPAPGQTATQTVVVTAQDGTTVKTYTINVIKNDAASTEAHLSALSVAGYTLTPAFAEGVFAYTITKAYGTENPATSAVSADPKDGAAHPHAEALENSFVITVTAEDGTTQLVYTINIEEAAAKKDLLEAKFEGNINGFIANGNINVPYLAGTAEPAFVAAKFWKADGEPTAEIVNGNLVVTGIDGETATYTITYVPVTPMEANYEEITFTEVPSYIYSVYGWDAEKGVKFAKDVEEASNRRISEGKDRIYIALPAAQNVSFYSGTTKRPVRIILNGEVYLEKVNTPAAGEKFTINLDPSAPNFICFESNGNNGDAGFVKMQLTEAWATGLDNTEADAKAIKRVINGQLFIEKNGVLYNAQGAVVK